MPDDNLLGHIPGDFYLPPHAGALITAIAQRSIFSSSAWKSLYPYTATLETRFTSEHECRANLTILDKLATGIRTAPRLLPPFLGKPSQSEGDVLIIGECHRRADIKMMEKLVLGLMGKDVTVLYLTPFGSAEHTAISNLAKVKNCQHRIIFLDPYNTNNRYENLTRNARIDNQLHHDLIDLNDVVPSDIYLKSGSIDWMRSVSMAKVAWDIWAPRLRFHTLIVRNHFNPLSAAAAISQLENGKPTITFQHGVISVPFCFLPLIATRQVCFGSPSAQLLSRLDNDLAALANRQVVCHDLMLGGSLFDDLGRLPANRCSATLLVIDQGTYWASEFYGIQMEFQALFNAVELVAKESKAIKRVIIRLHPDSHLRQHWDTLAEKYSGRIELSGFETSLSEDLARASVVLGLFSGAQITAAACGIPALFLWEPGWFYTPDLELFSGHAFVSQDEIVERLEVTLTSNDEYLAERTRTLASSYLYYHQGKTQGFHPEFIERLLAE